MGGAFECPRPLVRDVVRRALEEDLAPLGDLTAALLPDDATCQARFVARSAGVVAGTVCVEETFAQLDRAVGLRWELADGDHVAPGSVIGTVEGPMAPVLTGERTALNLLGHLSGVATTTARYVAAVADAVGPDRRAPLVWDTRKTTPGLRGLEKAAVRAGGGANHRGNLSDWVMLKDNHLALVDVADAVRRARQLWPGRTVHVECDELSQVAAAVEAGADAILLDNMAIDEVREAVAMARGMAGRPPLLEVSGGITLETIGRYAPTGVDCISVGSITNSAAVLDIGLDIDAQ